MTDERDENSQKDEAGILLGCYISYSNRTMLLFYRHLMRQSSRVNHRLENPPTPWGTEPPNVGFHSPRRGGISGGAKRHDTSVIYQ